MTAAGGRGTGPVDRIRRPHLCGTPPHADHLRRPASPRRLPTTSVATHPDRMPPASRGVECRRSRLPALRSRLPAVQHRRNGIGRPHPRWARSCRTDGFTVARTGDTRMAVTNGGYSVRAAGWGMYIRARALGIPGYAGGHAAAPDIYLRRARRRDGTARAPRAVQRDGSPVDLGATPVIDIHVARRGRRRWRRTGRLPELPPIGPGSGRGTGTHPARVVPPSAARSSVRAVGDERGGTSCR